MKLQLPLLLLPLLLPLSAATAAATAAAAADSKVATADALQATLDALTAAVDFVSDNIDSVNLDGAIGLRMAEGQTKALLAHYWSRLPQGAAARLAELHSRAGRAANRAVQSVRRRTPVYYANAGNMIREHFWDTFYPARPLPRAAVRAADKDKDFDEKFSDDCIKEFYGPDGKSPGCSVSERCWRGLVLPTGLTGYSLTHQLFYLMNGVQAGCLSNLTAQARAHPPAGTDGSLAGVFDNFCARIFVEASKLETAGFPKPDRDLFMEQVGLCGLAGYPEFARWRWLPVLLSWQRANGCFGEFPGELINPSNFDPGLYGNYKRRRKRAEMRMPEGCLSHRTSVAIAGLTAYCRRLVETLAD
ncbi:hypothetical protein BOX15_Mlig015391g1 [Macrostomum lignano]|uniref:Uncharacterized protein n=1 Tax=Macrostomum lignano TaxID=282301 RepID=A0A267FIH4_9PLAT|nr:hypothetical protein BOX15_Mlig015391g1 [Macrostomum lignano]